jgi:hypothetical protein
MNGVYFCNLGVNDREEQLNKRISSRNVPSNDLQPQFSSRPISTKYSLLPILDRRAVATEKIQQLATYNNSTVFNPGTAEAPWAGYSSKINVESELKNINFALQNADQAHFIPDTTSDMYINIINNGNAVNQPFPGLFTNPDLGTFNPNPCKLGQEIFNNNTRCQLKNINEK